MANYELAEKTRKALRVSPFKAMARRLEVSRKKETNKMKEMARWTLGETTRRAGKGGEWDPGKQESGERVRSAVSISTLCSLTLLSQEKRAPQSRLYEAHSPTRPSSNVRYLFSLVTPPSTTLLRFFFFFFFFTPFCNLFRFVFNRREKFAIGTSKYPI